MTEPIGATSPLMFSPDQYANALTPDALMVYLSTRLEGLDEQIQGIFKRQQTADEIRSIINEVKRLMNELPTDSDKNQILDDHGQVLQKIENLIKEDLHELDPKLAEKLTGALEADGFILHITEEKYRSVQIENTSKYLDDLSSELESASQMNMIRLQSLMSNRQTAVSLSTNLIAKLSESLEGVVNNIR